MDSQGDADANLIRAARSSLVTGDGGAAVLEEAQQVPASLLQDRQALPSTRQTPAKTNSCLSLSLASAWISVLAIAGCYVRIVLLASTPPTYTSYMSSQVVGSFILGLVVETRNCWWEPVYVGIAVGLCGSITTFSTWQVDAAENVGFPGYPITPSARAYNWFQTQMVGFAVPLCSLRFGKHCGLLCIGYFRLAADFRSAEAQYKWANNNRDWMTFVLLLVIICSVALSVVYTPSSTTIALILSPPGALIRYFLALRLNSPTRDRFPWGTFAANVGGSILSAALLIIESSMESISPLSCATLQGLRIVCGCLTTISTFVNEISTLETRMAYIYGLSSLIASQFCLLIMLRVSLSVGVIQFSAIC